MSFFFSLSIPPPSLPRPQKECVCHESIPSFLQRRIRDFIPSIPPPFPTQSPLSHNHFPPAPSTPISPRPSHTSRISHLIRNLHTRINRRHLLHSRRNSNRTNLRNRLRKILRLGKLTHRSFRHGVDNIFSGQRGRSARDFCRESFGRVGGRSDGYSWSGGVEGFVGGGGEDVGLGESFDCCRGCL